MVSVGKWIDLSYIKRKAILIHSQKTKQKNRFNLNSQPGQAGV